MHEELEGFDLSQEGLSKGGVWEEGPPYDGEVLGEAAPPPPLPPPPPPPSLLPPVFQKFEKEVWQYINPKHSTPDPESDKWAWGAKISDFCYLLPACSHDETRLLGPKRPGCHSTKDTALPVHVHVFPGGSTDCECKREHCMHKRWIQQKIAQGAVLAPVSASDLVNSSPAVKGHFRWEASSPSFLWSAHAKIDDSTSDGSVH